MTLELRRPTTQTVGRLLTLVVIALLATFLRTFGPAEPGMKSATMLLGFLLLAAFVAGDLARAVGLPRITGYLVIGLLFGPHVFHLLPRKTVEDFGLINGIALSVIALQAGGELRLERMFERLRAIGLITASQTVITVLGVTLAVYLASDLFPFLVGQPAGTVVAVALIFAMVEVANSPATTIAVITEMRARGPLTDIVLGVSVAKDVLILLLIAIVVPWAAVLADPTQGFDVVALREVVVQILFSLLIGAGVGGIIGLYLVRVNRQTILFALAMAFLIVELSHAIGFEEELSILMGMAAGFVVQNFSDQGGKLVEALEANSLPLYALFFAVAAAALDLSVIPSVWKAGLLIIVTRIALIYVSTRIGAVAAGESYIIKRDAWMGFLAKAGVTLGLAIIVADRFPRWGEQVAAIIIGMIAVNQLVGPPLFRLALVRAGETNAEGSR